MNEGDRTSAPTTPIKHVYGREKREDQIAGHVADRHEARSNARHVRRDNDDTHITERRHIAIILIKTHTRNDHDS